MWAVLCILLWMSVQAHAACTYSWQDACTSNSVIFKYRLVNSDEWNGERINIVASSPSNHTFAVSDCVSVGEDRCGSEPDCAEPLTQWVFSDSLAPSEIFETSRTFLVKVCDQCAFPETFQMHFTYDFDPGTCVDNVISQGSLCDTPTTQCAGSQAGASSTSSASEIEDTVWVAPAHHGGGLH